MALGGEIHQAALWSKKAIERLASDGLAPTPRNYTVYFEYCSGRTAELNTAIDAICRKGKISQAQCDELYYDYIVSDSEKEVLKKADETIDREIKKVLSILSASAKETDQFTESLGSFSGSLKSANSVEALREAVTKMAEETHNVTAQNEKLQTELEHTSQQLTVVRSDFDKAHRESQIDSLTEVGNRKFFDREIKRILGEATEQNSSVSLLMIDIDHFKKFNDTHGHLVGDQVLRLVAKTLVENLKGRDIIARYGGEEFVIVLPDTLLGDAERVANHLRTSLATKKITKRGTNEVLGTVTISIGAAKYIPPEDVDALIGRADDALYEAKQTGRNRVVCNEP